MGLLPSSANVAKIGLAKAQVLRGEKNVNLNRLRGYVLSNKPKINEGWIRRCVGEILLTIDAEHIPEAQHWIEEAIEANKRNQMMFELARDHAVYSELFKKKGDGAKAKEQLGKAIDIYKECGADGWVTKAEEGLAKLS